MHRCGLFCLGSHGSAAPRARPEAFAAVGESDGDESGDDNGDESASGSEASDVEGDETKLSPQMIEMEHIADNVRKLSIRNCKPWGWTICLLVLLFLHPIFRWSYSQGHTRSHVFLLILLDFAWVIQVLTFPVLFSCVQASASRRAARELQRAAARLKKSEMVRAVKEMTGDAPEEVGIERWLAAKAHKEAAREAGLVGDDEDMQLMRRSLSKKERKGKFAHVWVYMEYV